MYQYSNNIVNTAGASVPNAYIAVTSSNGTPAAIYSDDGITQISNPVQSNSAGAFSFYAAAGNFTLKIYGQGIATLLLPITLGSENVVALTYTSSDTSANQVIDSVSASSMVSAKYEIQITSGSAYQACEILLVQNGSIASITEYGDLYTSGSPLASFNALISNGNVQLVFTPVNSVTTVKAIRLSISQ